MLQASVASELQRAKGGGRHGYQGYFCKHSLTPRHSEGRERAGWRSSGGPVCERLRSEETTYQLQPLLRISYAVSGCKNKNNTILILLRAVYILTKNTQSHT